MQSLASLMSSAPSDIAPLDDLDGEDDGESIKLTVFVNLR